MSTLNENQKVKISRLIRELDNAQEAHDDMVNLAYQADHVPLDFERDLELILEKAMEKAVRQWARGQGLNLEGGESAIDGRILIEGMSEELIFDEEARDDVENGIYYAFGGSVKDWCIRVLEVQEKNRQASNEVIKETYEKWSSGDITSKQLLGEIAEVLGVK
jgi:hypothetical protein